MVTLGLLSAALAAQARPYRWVDSDGNVHYSDTPPPAAPPPQPVRSAHNGRFDVAVIVDTGIRAIPRSDVLRVFDTAAQHLVKKTGERMQLVELVYTVEAGLSALTGDPWALVNAYVKRRDRNPPEGIVVFTADKRATTSGGYALAYKPPFPYVNEYASPRPAVGSNRIYVAVVHFDHRYATCGYDEHGERVSAVSVGGECRNRPGTQCIPKGDEWVCVGTTSHLYSSHDFFIASAIVHEILHSFGFEDAAADHYGTPTCRARTGMTRDAADYDRAAQTNHGLCPDVFNRFRRSR